MLDTLSNIQLNDAKNTIPIVDGNWPYLTQPCLADIRNINGQKVPW